MHTRLGKPIPPPDPKASAAIAALNAQEEKAKASNGSVSGSVTISAAPTVKAPATPRITFVAGSLSNILVLLKTPFKCLVELEVYVFAFFNLAGNSAAASTSTATSATVNKPDDKLDDSTEDEKRDNDLLIDDRPAVGSEYIEEEKDATGLYILVCVFE